MEQEYRDACIFAERRSWRRFHWNKRVAVIDAEGLSFASLIDLSPLGMLVRSKSYLKAGSKTRLHISIGPETGEDINCLAIAERVSVLPDGSTCEIFFRIEENCVRKIINFSFLKNPA